MPPVAVTVAEPVQPQLSPDEATEAENGKSGWQELLIELIQLAFAALLGLPGVSLPAALAMLQLAWLAGFVFALFKLRMTLPPAPPEK